MTINKLLLEMNSYENGIWELGPGTREMETGNWDGILNLYDLNSLTFYHIYLVFSSFSSSIENKSVFKSDAKVFIEIFPEPLFAGFG